MRAPPPSPPVSVFAAPFTAAAFTAAALEDDTVATILFVAAVTAVLCPIYCCFVLLRRCLGRRRQDGRRTRNVNGRATAGARGTSGGRRGQRQSGWAALAAGKATEARRGRGSTKFSRVANDEYDDDEYSDDY